MQTRGDPDIFLLIRRCWRPLQLPLMRTLFALTYFMPLHLTFRRTESPFLASSPFLVMLTTDRLQKKEKLRERKNN